MAYAAVNSLADTINRLLNSPHISITHPFPEIVAFEDDELAPLQDVLRRLDSSSIRSDKLNHLDGEIRDAAYKLEDAIETLVSNQFNLSRQSEYNPPFSIGIDLDELKQDLDLFKHTVKKKKEDYVEELNTPQKVNADDAQVPSGGKKSKMVGLSSLASSIKDHLTNEDYENQRIVSISGMAGIGKSTVAREIFQDPQIVDHFGSRAWVRVGPEYEPKQIFRIILSQLDPQADDSILREGGDEELLERYLRESLRADERCLIVLDDIWESRFCDDLAKLLPDEDNGSRFFTTSTIDKVIVGPSMRFVSSCKVPFLSKEESWRLLCEKVFGDQRGSSCPRALEKAGKKIAEKCEGLPLLIVTVAGILSKAEITLEYWNEVAEGKNSVFADAYDQVSTSLLPSYNYLSQNLKPCFLYIGILPQGCEISRSKLTNLWRAEGFFERKHREYFEASVTGCLEMLVSRNIVIPRPKVAVLPWPNYNTEKYHLHTAFLFLSVRVARENKFYCVLNRFTEDAVQSMEGQRRLCVQNNVLFGVKDMNESMSSISAARSLLCTGPYHQYPVSVCFGLRLLKVLDSLTIRFYEFPVEVLELIQLRYLAMTYDGELPGSISQLWNLECLIVNRHIILCGVPSYLPMEIWDMKELKHLQVAGSDLRQPSGTSALPNLLTLLDVSQESCTKRVLERIPNLQKLGIRTGLRIGSADPMSCLDHIHYLNGVEEIALIVDPIFKSEVVAPPLPLPPSIINSHVRKLSLGGFGCKWEDMRLIASLQNLEALKLRWNACRGPKWETPSQGFQRLEYLLIEDCDLVVWELGERSFRRLERLTLKHCYGLEEIVSKASMPLEKIQVIDCTPSVVSWARDMDDYVYDVYIQSSWE